MNRAGWPMALALLWLFTWSHSARAWIELEQYRYGWAIPPLAVFLAVRRWRGSFAVPGHRIFPWMACGLGLALFARGAALARLDPSWRMTGVMLTLGAAVCTAGWFYLDGGWPLLRRQIFTLSFCFLALPWPKLIETPVTVTLLKTITSLVVIFLNLCGIAAAQQGNVIQLHQHDLGIETACSGIESLQAAIMAAVFLGELHRLLPSRRLLLVGAAFLLALAMNFARISVLASLMEFQGSETAARFHDLVGGLATTALFLLLVFAAGVGTPQTPPARASAGPVAAGAPAWAGWGGCIAIGCILAAVALVFPAAVPVAGNAPSLWKLNVSRLPPGWTAQRDPLATIEQTHPEAEERWRIQSPEGETAYVIYLHWKEGTQTQATAYPHSPSLCLPSQGWTQVGAPENVAVHFAMGEEPVPFTSWHFSQPASRLIALQCLASGPTYLPPPLAPSPSLGQKVLAQLYRRPRYVSEDLLIYLPETAEGAGPSRMMTELVKAFRMVR